MKDRTLFTAGASAIALLGASAIALLWVSEPDELVPRRAAAAPERAAEGAAPAFPTAAAAGSWTGGTPTPSAAPPPAPEDVDPSWRETRLPSRWRALGPVASFVIAGLKNAREEMGHCSASAERAPSGEAPPAAQAGGPPVAVLYLVARRGAIDVADVRIERLGAASPAVVECRLEVLRGLEIPAPNAVPGQRFRLRYPLD